MPFKCSVVNCRGNYDGSEGCSVYRLPKSKEERQMWTDAIPSFAYSKCSIESYRVCRKHWPEGIKMLKLPGGNTRPAEPPSIFNVPPSCMPIPRPPPRKPKVEFLQQASFDKADIITSFDSFSPKLLAKRYDNVITSKGADSLICIFMNEDSSDSTSVIQVINNYT
jgi:hypothetical protein